MSAVGRPEKLLLGHCTLLMYATLLFRVVVARDHQFCIIIALRNLVRVTIRVRINLNFNPNPNLRPVDRAVLSMIVGRTYDHQTAQI